MFAVAALEPSETWLTFKADPESFADLIERPKVIPAPYLARAKWVALETPDALPSDELAALLRTSYELVFAKLPKKTRDSLLQAPRGKARKAAKRKTRRR